MRMNWMNQKLTNLNKTSKITDELQNLEHEHFLLHQEIDKLEKHQHYTDQQLAQLKKRRLLLKDQIQQLKDHNETPEP